MDQSYYKCCIVPQCRSTSIKTPNKLFIYVPNNQQKRKKWLTTARRNDAHCLSTKSTMYFCEDHFDLPNDMLNYTEYHIMGKVSRVRMRPNCIPSKFACQEDKRKRTCGSTKRSYVLKNQGTNIIEGSLKEQETTQSSPHTGSGNPQLRPFLKKKKGKGKAVPKKFPCSSRVSTPTSRNVKDEEAGICDDNMDDAEDNTNTLVESNVCRVCLAMDVKMYDLKDTELRGMFQNVTGICVPENNHSVLERLCWECVGRLKTAAAFRNKALVSDTLLQGLASTGEQIRKNDIITIKENKEYIRPAGTLSIVEVFHPVNIDPKNDSLPHLLENNDTNIVEHTVGNDSYKIKKENISDEDIDQMVIKDEPMIEIPIKTETEYDQFDYLYPNTGEESRNVFTETNPLVSNDISLRENIINLPDSSPLPGCSHADPKYPVVGSHQNTLNNCKDKIKRNAIVINKKDLSAKIVLKKPKVLLTDKSKTLNVIMGGVRKKILIINKATKTQVNTHTGEE